MNPNPYLQYDLTEIEQSVAARFETQVTRNPNAIAVQDANGALTYDELNRRANRLAHAILAQRDSAPEAIAILVEHSAASVIAILGILKAGKFYVPLDLSLTHARLETILQDCGAPLLVTNSANQSRAQAFSNQVALLDLDTLDSSIPDTNANLTISPDTLLNIMYTSGTKGEPKGVIQLQRNLLHVYATTNFPPHQPNEHVAQLTAFSFGGSAAMLFRTLFFGATVYPFNLKQMGLPRLTAFLHEHAIARFHSVPSVLRNWLALLPPHEMFPDLRVVEVGGEPLFKRDLERLLQHVPKECWVRNALGTTETYVATWNFVNASSELEEGVIPVGYAPPNFQALVVDAAGQPVPTGEPGEILIASRYISPGYWHKPELTAKTFLSDPAQPGVLIYKTSDLGRLREDGALEHLGRQDGMVKIRGHQVVLTFVESAIRALDGVQDVAVIAHENAAGDMRLIAYVVADNAMITPNVLRAALSPTLLDYMIPSTFVLLKELPKLPNGKLDRRALPALDDGQPRAETPFVAPRTPIEAQLAQIWGEVLGISRVGVNDAFIELGGNSLQAAQVVVRASNAVGIEIPLSAVFDVPTIEGLAQLITQRLAERVETDNLEEWLNELEVLDTPSPTA